MNVLEHALACVARGWAVLPIYDVDADGVCTCWQRDECPTPGKHPRTEHGYKGASKDEATIRRWLERQWPARCNLAIATGHVSKLVVIDVDPKTDGFTTLVKLERELGALPLDTTRVRTGSSGLHMYGCYPDDVTIRTNQKQTLGAGIDVLSDGIYAVCPPSVTNKGAYTWLLEGPLAPIPMAWLQRLVSRPARQREDRADGDAQAGGQGDASLPLGQDALEFIYRGVPYGEQRMRACAATRNLLALGKSAEEVIDLIWQGMERSPTEPGRRPWTRAEVAAIVVDLERSEPKPLREREADGALASRILRPLSERRALHTATGPSLSEQVGA
jgi:hypothetical protein